MHLESFSSRWKTLTFSEHGKGAANLREGQRMTSLMSLGGLWEKKKACVTSGPRFSFLFEGVRSNSPAKKKKDKREGVTTAPQISNSYKGKVTGSVF